MMGVYENTGVTMAGDVPPVMTGMGMSAAFAPSRFKTVDKVKKPYRRSRMVSGIIGRLKEDEDEQEKGVIPGDAKEVDSLVTSVSAVSVETPVMPDPDKPASMLKPGEPLISPAAALVAPDVTPDSLKPLDPSQVPGADKGTPPEAMPAPSLPSEARYSPTEPGAALDMVLGRTAPANMPAYASSGPALQAGGTMPVESMLPGIPSPSTFASSAATAVPLSEAALMRSQGAGMPEHIAANGDAVLSAFRRFSH